MKDTKIYSDSANLAYVYFELLCHFIRFPKYWNYGMVRVQYSRVYISFVTFLEPKNQILAFQGRVPSHGASGGILALVPRHRPILRTDFKTAITSSLLVGFKHMIYRWKAYLKIFNLICNMLHKSSKIFIKFRLQSDSLFCS